MVAQCGKKVNRLNLVLEEMLQNREDIRPWTAELSGCLQVVLLFFLSDMFMLGCLLIHINLISKKIFHFVNSLGKPIGLHYYS